MLKTGILNPLLNSLLSRVRHSNTLIIADRGFPFGQQSISASKEDDLAAFFRPVKGISPEPSPLRLKHDQ